MLATLRAHFREKCLEPIRTNTRLAEAPSHKKTIFEYAPASHGASDYGRVCDWVITTTSQAEASLFPGPVHDPGPSPVPRPRPDIARPELLEAP